MAQIRRYGGPGWGVTACDRGLPGGSGPGRSVVACGLDGRTGELSERRMCPDHAELLEWSRELPGPVAVAYEAGPTGFGLARFLTAEGIDCLVAAPSKL